MGAASSRSRERAPMHPHVLDLDGAAALIKTRPSTVRSWAHDGVIPGTRVGGRWRFWAPSLLERVIGAEAARHATPPLPDGHTEPEVVDTGELAGLLGLPALRVAILQRQGRIPGEKVGGQWRAYWPCIQAKIVAGAPLTDVPEDAEDADDPGEQAEPP